MRTVGEEYRLAHLLGGVPVQMSEHGAGVFVSVDRAAALVGALDDGVGSVAQSGPRDAATSGGQAQTREVVMSEAKPTSDDQSRNLTAPDDGVQTWTLEGTHAGTIVRSGPTIAPGLTRVVGLAASHQAEAAARAVYERHGHIAPWDAADEVLRGMYIAEQRAALEAALGVSDER